MKKLLPLIAAGLLPLFAISQSTLVLQPNAAAGKDASVYSCESCGFADKNYAGNIETGAVSWTRNGTDHKVRSLLEFNLSAIPEGSRIISATLSLYHATGSQEGNHFGFFGSNKAWLERITSSWNEYTVTWNTQPSTTPLHRVAIAGTTSQAQNFTNITVTQLVQDMITDPVNSHGLMLKLQSETVYKKLVFASSDHPNEALRPKLTIVYEPPSRPGVIERSVDFPPAQVLHVFPNPARDVVHLAINAAVEEFAFVSVYDLNGKEMTDQSFQLHDGKNQYSIETSAWPRGVYMVMVKTQGQMITERLLLE